jgi:hypothetical protein
MIDRETHCIRALIDCSSDGDRCRNCRKDIRESTVGTHRHSGVHRHVPRAGRRRSARRQQDRLRSEVAARERRQTDPRRSIEQDLTEPVVDSARRRQKSCR